MADGRPTKYDEKMTPKLINMPPHLIEFAEEVGYGTLAEGVRRCIEREMDRRDTNDTD